jgi:spermidine/putrescine transport system substrate-binding protein
MTNNKRFLLISGFAAALTAVLIGNVATTAVAQSATMAATMAGTDAGGDATMAPTSALVFTPVATAAPKADGSLQELHVYNYTTYIADDTISNFEKLYHVKVTYDTYATSPEMVTKIQGGNPGYDIIVPPDYSVSQLAKAGLLLPLDLSKLPNFTKYAGTSFKSPIYDKDNKYSVPYQWGTIGIGYSPKRVGKTLSSWNDLFDPKLKGRVAILDSERESIAIVLNLLGKDPNSTNKADLDAVKKFFIDHKDVIARFHAADGQFDVAKGSLDAISDWNGDFYQVTQDPANAGAGLEFVLPKEGTVRWVDNLVIPKGAPNPSLALTFINYLFDPQVAADISNSIGYATPNQGAIDQGLISKDDLANPALYAPDSVKQFTLVDLGDAQTLYDTTWADIKAAVSQ